MVRMFIEAEMTDGQGFMNQNSIAQNSHLEIRPLDMAKHPGP